MDAQKQRVDKGLIAPAFTSSDRLLESLDFLFFGADMLQHTQYILQLAVFNQPSRRLRVIW